MPLRINRVARGLLSYLDSKNAGQPPQFVADQIAATLELEEMFFASQAVDLFGDVATASTGAVGIALASNFMGVGGGAFRVPPGEIWLVRNATARMDTLPVGTSYLFTIGYQPVSSAGVGIWNALANPVAVGMHGAGTSPVSCCTAPFVMVPGDQFGILITNLVLGTATRADVNARCVRLLV